MDREKVIKALETHTKMDGHCEDCPYENYSMCMSRGMCVSRVMTDALALLKEQEEQIEQLEHDLAVTQNNLNYYVNGND